MELVRDVPLDVDLESLAFGDFDDDELRRLFDFLEFRTLFERLEEALDLLAQAPVPHRRPARRSTRSSRWWTIRPMPSPCSPSSVRRRRGPIALAGGWERGRERLPLEGIAVVTDRDAAEVAWLPAALLADPAVADALRSLTAPATRPAAVRSSVTG